eukprot:Skav223537  [mRNA]  locus=scaffold4327:6580:8414:- [translate_table: standard]
MFELPQALQGFEARLSARELCVGSDGNTVVLGMERRYELSGHFSSDLAELLALAMPSCAKIAQCPEVVLQEAEKHITCVAWEAVLTCKTQITDLYMDNDELSKRRLEDLALDAAKILDSEEIPVIEGVEDAKCVREFLLGASQCIEAWQVILKRLRQDSLGVSTWAEVAASVLEELRKEEQRIRLQQEYWQKEESAARCIQRLWRLHVKNPPQFARRGRRTNAHEITVDRIPSQKSAHEMRVDRNPSQRSAYEMRVDRNPSQRSAYEMRVDRNPSQRSAYEMCVDKIPSQKSAAEMRVDRNPSQRSAYEMRVDRNPSQRSAYEMCVDRIPSQKSAHEMRVDRNPSQRSAYEMCVDRIPSQKSAHEMRVDRNPSQKSAYEMCVDRFPSQKSDKTFVSANSRRRSSLFTSRSASG